MSATETELERLLRFVYLSPVGTVHASRGGAIELVNPRAAALLVPLSPDGNLDNVFALLEPHAPGLSEIVARYPHETGTIVERMEVSVVVGSPRGIVLAIDVVAIDRTSCVVVITDVTEVAEQKRRLHSQDQRLRGILDVAQDFAIFTLDRSGRFDEWNSSVARFTDTEPELVVGSSLDTLFDPDSSPVDTASLLEEAIRFKAARFEGQLRSSARGPRSAEALLSPLRDPKGAVSSFGVVLHDTTVRREHEQQLLKLATTDPLTGAQNRRAFLDTAELELRRSVRYQRPLSLLILDVDHFKALNDGYGHEFGDIVLVQLVDTLRRMVREVDTVARWGGEEFVILAPETALSSAGTLAERLRIRVSRLTFDRPGCVVRVTVSIGVAARNTDGDDTIEHMLARADAALYAAKTGGRNRVMLG